MLTKADINSLFGTSGISLKKMYKKASEILEKKEYLFIDFGSGAELIDSVMRDPYSKRVTFFYYFGEDRRSVTLCESDEPTFRYNSVFGMYSLVGVTRKDVTKDKESFTVLNLDGFFEHCEATLACGKVTYWVSGIQMRYLDAETVDILKKAVFRFVNKHGDIETFCSTSDTRLRVLKMGDETQLHLESAKKMKLD